MFWARSGWPVREAIIEACHPTATAFNRSWMPFRTQRCRWPFFSWELGEQEIIDAATAAKQSRATIFRWRKSGAGPGCPRELRLRAGKWLVFFCLEPPDFIRVPGTDNRVKLTDPHPSNCLEVAVLVRLPTADLGIRWRWRAPRPATRAKPWPR